MKSITNSVVYKKKLAFSLLVLFLCSCGGHRQRGRKTSNSIPTQRPYVIRGHKYYPITLKGNYREVGVASWYGEDFHGKPTASGETYNMHALSAAHTKLPIGTWVTVRNLDNNRKIRVRINDRGPFVAGRVIDLSYYAAKKLGFARKGTTRVLITARKGRTKTAKKTARTAKWRRGERFFVQVAAFKSLSNAKWGLSKLSARIPAMRLIYDEKSGYYRLCTSYFYSKKAAEQARFKAVSAGYADSFIVAR